MLNIQLGKKRGKKLYICGLCFTFTNSLCTKEHLLLPQTWVKGDVKGSNLMEVVLELYLPISLSNIRNSNFHTCLNQHNIHNFSFPVAIIRAY